MMEHISFSVAEVQMFQTLEVQSHRTVAIASIHHTDPVTASIQTGPNPQQYPHAYLHGFQDCRAKGGATGR